MLVSPEALRNTRFFPSDVTLKPLKEDPTQFVRRWGFSFGFPVLKSTNTSHKLSLLLSCSVAEKIRRPSGNQRKSSRVGFDSMVVRDRDSRSRVWIICSYLPSFGMYWRLIKASLLPSGDH